MEKLQVGQSFGIFNFVSPYPYTHVCCTPIYSFNKMNAIREVAENMNSVTPIGCFIIKSVK